MQLIKNNNQETEEEVINEEKIINQMRALAIDMINEAQSGHPGVALGAAPIMYTLYAKHMRVSSDNSKFFNRDRFILSNGHASSLLYATLYMAGFPLELDDLKKFRQIDSKCPGHPEVGITPGVDMTTGPLGQGLATAIGMALAEARFSKKYNSYQKNLIDYNTYVLCGDGDLEEGVSYEAMSLAGTLKLNKLIVLYDSNDIQLDGKTSLSFTENIELRMKSMNWNYLKVEDGEDFNAIDKAIITAKENLNGPTLIEIKTKIGKFSINEGTNKVHGSPLTSGDITSIKEKMKLRDISFSVTSDTVEAFQNMIEDRCKNIEKDFLKKLDKLPEDIKQELSFLMGENKKIEITNLDYKLDKEKEALRDTSSKILNSIVKDNPFIIGGSADLFGATKTYINEQGDLTADNYLGKNIYFGVREHAMGCILNGLALSGYRVYGSTFMAFSNYLMPAIRMAAILNLPVTYIFTHDSISLGEDGITHQPVEQLLQLRAIPNVELFRPSDANEVIGVYKEVFSKNKGVSVISLSKTAVPVLESSSINNITKGGYIIKEYTRKLDGIIISTGEEVHLAVEVANRLASKGFDIRVVSMPCIERFLENDKEYIDEILPVGVKKIVIEPAVSMSWTNIVYNSKYLITLDQFGASGKSLDVYKKYGFDIDSLETKIEQLLK